MRALVTGGRGGIGEAVVDRLVERGYDVTVADAGPVPARDPRPVSHVQADLSEESAVAATVRSASAGEGLQRW